MVEYTRSLTTCFLIWPPDARNSRLTTGTAPLGRHVPGDIARNPGYEAGTLPKLLVGVVESGHNQGNDFHPEAEFVQLFNRPQNVFELSSLPMHPTHSIVPQAVERVNGITLRTKRKGFQPLWFAG